MRPPCFAWVFMVGLLSAFVFGGCASLPDVEGLSREVSERGLPDIVGPKGRLSPQATRGLLERLRQQGDPGDILGPHLALMETVSGRPLVAGNKVTLLVDGKAAYAAMFRAIENARDHVHLETFILNDDEVGRRFAELFLQKQAEGIQVSIIYDRYGSRETSSAFFEGLRQAGIQVLGVNPIAPWKAAGEWHPMERDHRKILVVDGRIAFTGGVNISVVYREDLREDLSSADRTIPWRDTDVQIEGPAVADLQRLFLESWARGSGSELPQRGFFPPLKKEGNALLQVLGSTPGQINRTTYVMYVSALSCAERFAHITNAYFAPDEETLEALEDAARRGVEVKLILPRVTDQDTVLYAGKSYYERLLKAGVRLFERDGVMLHAKTAVIDGVWSTVGSTNLDMWALLRDDEVNVVILDRDFAVEMEALFAQDLSLSEEIHLERWEERSLHERLREWLSRLVRYWL